MGRKQKVENIVLDLVYNGNYDIVQQINYGEEEPYEGCTRNLCMVIESGEATVQKLDESDSRSRKGCNTYTIKYSTYLGDVLLIIWEV